MPQQKKATSLGLPVSGFWSFFDQPATQTGLSIVIGLLFAYVSYAAAAACLLILLGLVRSNWLKNIGKGKRFLIIGLVVIISVGSIYSIIHYINNKQSPDSKANSPQFDYDRLAQMVLKGVKPSVTNITNNSYRQLAPTRGPIMSLGEFTPDEKTPIMSTIPAKNVGDSVAHDMLDTQSSDVVIVGPKMADALFQRMYGQESDPTGLRDVAPGQDATAAAHRLFSPLTPEQSAKMRLPGTAILVGYVMTYYNDRHQKLRSERCMYYRTNFSSEVMEYCHEHNGTAMLVPSP